MSMFDIDSSYLCPLCGSEGAVGSLCQHPTGDLYRVTIEEFKNYSFGGAVQMTVNELKDKNVKLKTEHDRLRDALGEARAYVAEPGSPGTIIETTEESAERSAALLARIDALLERK